MKWICLVPSCNHPKLISITDVSSFFICEIKPASAWFWFFGTKAYSLPSKLGKNCWEMWNRNEAYPTAIPMKSWHRSKLKVTLPILLHTCYLESNRFFLWRFQRCVSLVYRYTVRFININRCFTMSWNFNLPQENLQVASNYKQDYSRALLLKPRSSFYAHQYYSEGSDIVDRVSVSCSCLGDCWCNLPYL